MRSSTSKRAQIKALKNGKGVQDLIDKASLIFKNPILMHDLDYRAIAYTANVVTDDPFWNEFVTLGGHSRELVEILKDEYLIDTAANAETITVLSSEKIGYDRLFGKIVNKDKIIVAGVDVVACSEPFDDDDTVAFEEFCKTIIREISKDEFYQNYGEVYQENLIGKLIDGSIEDKRLYPVHVQGIYSRLKNNLYLAAAVIIQCGHEDIDYAYFKNLFRQAQRMFLYAVYSNYIIIIISTDNVALNAEKDMKKLIKLFEQYNIYAGISDCFENLFELQKYYKEAVDALNCGMKSDSKGRIFLYDDIKQSSEEE